MIPPTPTADLPREVEVDLNVRYIWDGRPGWAVDSTSPGANFGSEQLMSAAAHAQHSDHLSPQTSSCSRGLTVVGFGTCLLA